METAGQDVFQALLAGGGLTKAGQWLTQSGSSACLPFDLNSSINPVLPQQVASVELDHRVLQSCLQQGGSVLDYAADDVFLYVLVDMSARCEVWVFRRGRSCVPAVTPVGVLQTNLDSISVRGAKSSLNPATTRHLYVVHHNKSDSLLSPSGHLSHPGLVPLPIGPFAAIFGRQVSLTNSPVILLCSHDGRVSWCAFKLPGQGRASGFSPLCQVHGTTQSVVSVSVTTKQGMSNAVAEVLDAALSCRQAGAGKMEGLAGLLVVSDIGDCCLMLPILAASREGDCQWRPLPFCLPHHVLSCVATESQFIYSTGTSLWSTPNLTPDPWPRVKEPKLLC